MQSTDVIASKCKSLLEAHYGPRFQGLVVYGSIARKEATPASDIDMLVLLTSPFDYFVELLKIIDLLYPVQLESDRLISAKPVFQDEYEQGRFLLYRNAKREGILV